ncbi:MAG: response regulator transcription factor [Methylococcaceae bacterium]|nr:response regulator transcription factor [Methylococcaceae bacterium]
MNTSPFILLIDDHALFRTGVRLVLNTSMPSLQVQEAESLEQAMRNVSEPPELIVLDVQLVGLNGIEGIALLKRKWPLAPVVMLSSHADTDTVTMALARGAAAFVSKAETADKIVNVIGQILHGQADDHPARVLKKSAVPSFGAAPANLTPRQCEVLDFVCQGLSNKAIARRLALSENTVRGHVQAILEFLHAGSRSEAAFIARRLGLVD